MSKLIGDLSAILGDGLLVTEAERSARARDTWMRSQIPISAGSPVTAPLAVCAPSSSEQLSEGTLGVITEVTFSVRRQAESEVRQAFHFEHFDAGLEAVRKFMRDDWRPAVVRLYDGRESWRHFRERLPKGNAMLILAHMGSADLAAAEAAAVSGICGSGGGVAAADDVVDTWFERRNTVPTWEELLAQGIVADTIEIAADWTRLGALYRAVIDALEAVDGVVAASAHTSHAYRSGANLYFTLAATPESPDDYASTYDACWAAAMNAAAGVGAGLAHHHGIGRVRRDWLGVELGDAGVSLLRAVKQAIDPLSLMNPGVLLP